MLTWLVDAGSVGLFGLFVFVIKRWTATASAYALTLMPVIAVATGSLIANEAITAELVVGGLLVLSGGLRRGPLLEEATNGGGENRIDSGASWPALGCLGAGVTVLYGVRNSTEVLCSTWGINGSGNNVRTWGLRRVETRRWPGAALTNAYCSLAVGGKKHYYLEILGNGTETLGFKLRTPVP